MTRPRSAAISNGIGTGSSCSFGTNVRGPSLCGRSLSGRPFAVCCFRQAGGAIWTYLETHTVERFLAGLKEHRPANLNPKYKAIIDEQKRNA